MSKSIPNEFRDLFAKRAYGSLGTLRSDGSPQVTPVWCDAESDDVVILSYRDPRSFQALHYCRVLPS